jgi:hypothetical protein
VGSGGKNLSLFGGELDSKPTVEAAVLCQSDLLKSKKGSSTLRDILAQSERSENRDTVHLSGDNSHATFLYQ